MSENAAVFFGKKQLICVQLPQLQQQLECVAISDASGRNLSGSG